MNSGVPWNPSSLKIWRSERRRTIRKIKTDLGCCHCKGRFPHYGLDFHHLDASKKTFNISRNMYCAWSTLLKELENCTVLCRICHGGVTCGEVFLSASIRRAWVYKKSWGWR